MIEGVNTMEGLMTVADLIRELSQMKLDAPVFIAVTKYPGEFKIDFDDEGHSRWMDHEGVECTPLTEDEVIEHSTGIVFISAEVQEFNEERWMLNGNRTD